ncbi:MAG TPA: BON domain-containing protein [Candidatus Saccharimonadales bacterium]|nr:BON domain-containing protein [Candidatus Saccharimonadales bacterium]
MKNYALFALLLCGLFAAGCFSGSSGSAGAEKLDSYLDDKVMADRVENSLHHSSKMFSDIHAASTNGVVYITGSVTTLGLRQIAAQLARKVDGVKEVHNEVSIREGR